jgi:hypothetical protein
VPGNDLSRCGKQTCANARLVDHIVGACEKGWWQGETEYFGGLEVDDQFELAQLYNWQIACFLALQNTAGIKNPITGTSCCCARAASGYAAAALPRNVMKSRRFN